ncbi:MAG: GHMP kinase [Butyrivibrio sp.]|nr:GHMP kinase [Butyrivibrio sp.]
MSKNSVEKFYSLYLREPDGIAFCPYRISPLGAHIDHQGGIVNGMAIDKGIHMAYGRKNNGVVEVQSLNFPNRVQFHVREVQDEKVGDWADYLRGAAKMLSEEYPLKYGVCGVIEGSLPIGGLSSSAAVTICFLQALCSVNNIELEADEYIRYAKRTENLYVGVNCGILDQSCEVLCEKDSLLYLDCETYEHEQIRQAESMPDYEIAIFFSGLERSLANSKYNLRVDECKASAYYLMAYAGIEYNKLSDTRLRQVPFEIYMAYRDRLPETFCKRTDHFYSEMRRAREGADAWKKGDLVKYGKLMFESGQSSIGLYECGCPELISLYWIMRETPGVYGGRFSGAGFKGCCMALIDPSKKEEIEYNVRSAYLKEYPSLEGKYCSCFCKSADGVMAMHKLGE